MKAPRLIALVLQSPSITSQIDLIAAFSFVKRCTHRSIHLAGTKWSLLVLLVVLSSTQASTDRYADHEKLVAETHAVSLKQREEGLRKTISKDSAWPPGIWGDNLWTLSALTLNEKVEVANARLLKAATAYIETTRSDGPSPAPTPEQPGNAPWTFFSITDYVRTLCLFHAKSAHFPGRLTPETEAAMKEALWLWVSRAGRMADIGPDHLLHLLGTENHDLNLRPNFYLVTALLKEDPIFKGRNLADGHSIEVHAAAHTAFFQQWPIHRAGLGLWIEVGSNTYQKYSWPALFNLHELAPDPVVRHRFGLLLDLALIEEEQLSIRGHRGGGRSRAENARGGFEPMKSLLYGEGGGSSHSRVIEASAYLPPAEAILLRKRAFPTEKTFLIRNRVLGLCTPDKPEGAPGQRIAADSALVNIAYRSPHYLLGSTLQNPSLSYAGISRQKRTCGLLFEQPVDGKISQLYPYAEHTGGGRSQHSFWSVQHKNVLLIQRIARHGKSPHGSYNTGKLGVRFDGATLERIEKGGWIFTSDGKAFAGVKFLDGDHTWDDKNNLANPADFAGHGDTTRILLHAGDITTHPSFEEFQQTLLNNHLMVSSDKIDYRFNEGKDHLESHRYDAVSPTTFILPRINGEIVDLNPAAAYDSPYLKGAFGGERFTVSVGPLHRTIDFSKESP